MQSFPKFGSDRIIVFKSHLHEVQFSLSGGRINLNLTDFKSFYLNYVNQKYLLITLNIYRDMYIHTYVYQPCKSRTLLLEIIYGNLKAMPALIYHTHTRIYANFRISKEKG